MVLKEAMFRQFRRPTGWLGKFIAVGMNVEHQALWRWALEHVPLRPDAVILDVGCGGGKSIEVLARRARQGKVYGIDYSKDMVQTSRFLNRGLIRSGRAEIRHASVSCLPFPDHSFDLVVCFECCYFWPDMIRSLKEIRRVLKQNGLLLIANEAHRDPRFDERNATWARLANMQVYGPQEYRAFLSRAGFGTVQIETRPERNWIVVVAAPAL
jgi:ubiquinone/menaquinone biosynthesis C-methylase UbiE